VEPILGEGGVTVIPKRWLRELASGPFPLIMDEVHLVGERVVQFWRQWWHEWSLAQDTLQTPPPDVETPYARLSTVDARAMHFDEWRKLDMDMNQPLDCRCEPYIRHKFRQKEGWVYEASLMTVMMVPRRERAILQLRVREKIYAREVAAALGGKMGRTVADLRFEATPDATTAIIGALDASAAIDAISDLRLSYNAGTKRVGVQMTVEKWGVTRKNARTGR